MDADYFYYTLMLIPMLAGRSMVAVFSSALIAYLSKSGHLDYDWVKLEQLAVITNLPDWVTDPKFLVATFILSILEYNISRSPSFQEIWALNEAKIKGAFACIIAALMADQSIDVLIKSAFAESISDSGQVENSWMTLDNAWAGCVGFITWALATIRSNVMFFLMEVDQDDNFGIQNSSFVWKGFLVHLARYSTFHSLLLR